MLEASGLTRRMDGRTVLDRVSLSAERGTVTTVLGPSGSGKTTLLRLLMGLDPLDAGELRVDREILSGHGVHVAPEKRGLAMVFQEFTLFPHLDALANVTFGVTPGAQTDARVAAVLAMLEIEALRRRSVTGLSGGEQQRVALARALVVRPRVLLLDEPFSNIDQMLRARLFTRVKAYLDEAGITTVLATHDHAEAFFFSDRIAVLKDGRLIDVNSPQRIYRTPRNAWVAKFFGAANILNGAELSALYDAGTLSPDMQYLLRPETLERVPVADGRIAGTVEAVRFNGAFHDTRIVLDDGGTLTVRDMLHEPAAAGTRVGVRLRPGCVPHPLEAAIDE